jgi:hypothetical protein
MIFMRRLLVIALCFAACDSGKRAPSQRRDAAPPPPGDAMTVAPVAVVDASIDGPAPVDSAPTDPLATFHDVAKVMIAEDGSFVLLNLVDPDGARGAPNLAFELRDRSDRKTARVDVLKLDEEPSAETLENRVAAAQRLLRKQPLWRMTELVGDQDTGRFEGDNVVVIWKRQHITIKHVDATVVDRDVPAAWLHKPYYAKHEGITCKNPAFLREVYVMPVHNLAVVEVAYSGTDSCWAPSPQLHVIAWN